jgi:endonuclease-3
MIRIAVKLIGPAARAVGESVLEYALVPPARLETVLDLMFAKYPRLAAEADSLRFTVNGNDAQPSARLSRGDEVTMALPPARKKKSARSGSRTATTRRASAESLDERKKRVRKIITRLKKLYPEADCALKHRSALQLLVSTILSAQSTDETVNKVTPVLFAKYPTAEKLASADPAEIERLIRTTGFFRQKTKSVIGACRAITGKFGGQVPGTMDELVQLPGVARKTANVVLGSWFRRAEGVVVDTHVGRLAHRLGLTWSSKNDKDAVKIERDLCQVLGRKEWIYMGHALIWHGRRVCFARKPDCRGCTLNTLCPSAFTFDTTAKAAVSRKKTKA